MYWLSQLSVALSLHGMTCTTNNVRTWQCAGREASKLMGAKLRISRATLRTKLLEHFPRSSITYGKACAAVNVLTDGEGPPVRITFQACQSIPFPRTPPWSLSPAPSTFRLAPSCLATEHGLEDIKHTVLACYKALLSSDELLYSSCCEGEFVCLPTRWRLLCGSVSIIG